ncbi:glycosyltransferase [Microvirga rosea]|uniref:glycosyltransferase n=1 Tax=Microvirga rosea TaxID=2715425 RepID=UPI001D0BB01D|nr:glycosyltransferase [Microvirga rosea]MCB8823457.1 glycosyltransferase [Microvirga rosea]
MNILHITPHLGGGVGKAHSAIYPASARRIRREYILLEEPRDRRYVEVLESAGAAIRVMPGVKELFDRAQSADIVQIEWWNHPRVYEFLCRVPLPAMRTVFWSHISGICSPYIPSRLIETAHRFLFTSECSLNAPNVASLSKDVLARLDVVNSGFGYGESADPRARTDHGVPTVTYLGTVDFSKMSPLLFDVVDRARDENLKVSVWGNMDSSGEVSARVAKMRGAHRVQLMGHTQDPRSVLDATDIFLYLLQPNHFGTAENALIEAMSLGCVPLVLSNPAELAIVRHGETGFVESDLDAVVARLDWMMANPDLLTKIGQRAAADVNSTRTPKLAALALERNYEQAMEFEKQQLDYSDVLGRTGLDWFLSTQTLDPIQDIAVINYHQRSRNKGSLLHFVDCLPEDSALIDFAAS